MNEFLQWLGIFTALIVALYALLRRRPEVEEAARAIRNEVRAQLARRDDDDPPPIVPFVPKRK